MTTSAVANPGSEEAIHAGCTCPVLDNRRGKGVPMAGGVSFWINGGCPVHCAVAASATLSNGVLGAGAPIATPDAELGPGRD